MHEFFRLFILTICVKLYAAIYGSPCMIVSSLSKYFQLRACLHEVGGPQVGEVDRLGGVTRLFI